MLCLRRQRDGPSTLRVSLDIGFVDPVLALFRLSDPMEIRSIGLAPEQGKNLMIRPCLCVRGKSQICDALQEISIESLTEHLWLEC